MNTPICDFVKNYAEKNMLRLHMPGHKGKSGYEYDITEISGADSLYEASGIIAESEKNASDVFGCNTLYSTEGSSLAIRAMLYLAVLYARKNGEEPYILAGRNAHKVFITAAAMLDFEVSWIGESSTYLSCNIDLELLEEKLKERKPTAVYITSPDYLGNMADVKTLSNVCHKYGVLLLVDNAHGAYLKFLETSQHPIDLGCDMCADSAHKTLGVLTGGAYLHISDNAPKLFFDMAKSALAMFGSTSPSYLILASLDRINPYLCDGYKNELKAFLSELNRSGLREFDCMGNEPLKLTIPAKKYGYLGTELAGILEGKNIICEFSDPDYVVLMLTPEIGADGIKRLSEALTSIPKRAEITVRPPKIGDLKRSISIREAVFSECETVEVEKSLGRVLAQVTLSCPPAVPIAVCGEVIDESAVEAFLYYGIEYVDVIK